MLGVDNEGDEQGNPTEEKEDIEWKTSISNGHHPYCPLRCIAAEEEEETPVQHTAHNALCVSRLGLGLGD